MFVCEEIDDFSNDGSSFARASTCDDKGVFVVVGNDFGLVFIQSVGNSVVADVVFKPALDVFDLAHNFKL